LSRRNIGPDHLRFAAVGKVVPGEQFIFAFLAAAVNLWDISLRLIFRSSRRINPPSNGSGAAMSSHHEQTARSSRGFGQLFGLDPRIAFLTFVVDLMLFGGTVLTFGLLIPIAIAAGVVLGFITYRAQLKWYGDDHESALIKGVIIGLLTAIPTPLPAIVYLPSGVLGLIHTARRGWTRIALGSQGPQR
jgi:hypothetical protein